MDQIDLLWWGSGAPSWSHGTVRTTAPTVAAGAEALAELAAEGEGWILLWDRSLPLPADDVLAELVAGRADAWHAGLVLGLSGVPDEHDYIQPTWPLALDAAPELASSSWRASIGALLVRADVVRALGGLDPAFDELTGAGLELGRRMIERGAVVCHTPSLVPGARPIVAELTEHDRFLLLRRWFAPKWVTYAALRRAVATRRPRRALAGLRRSGETAARRPAVLPEGAVVERPEAAVPTDARVSVVLPTLGRYELVAGVLEQLTQQTVAPHQVVVVDQNEPGERDEDLYRRFGERLPLEVVFQDERGQWVSRNEAIRRATGDWLCFIDDDSAIVDDFIERHLEGLLRYDADLTTGASRAVVRAPVPENYAFFRVADQWDSGNGLCHRRLLERFGLFDEQFDRQRRGDAEFGLRVQLGGGLVVHVPGAIRTHLKADKGGLRTYGSWDGFRHRDRSSPLPLPAMVYYTKRYHTRRQLREDLLIGVAQAIVPYELKRRATPVQWAGFVLAELRYLPSTVRRIRRSLELADAMVEEGPKIAALPPV
ncbi:MAG: glycosyltransferase [Acidimicrobiales bacterium]